MDGRLSREMIATQEPGHERSFLFSIVEVALRGNGRESRCVVGMQVCQKHVSGGDLVPFEMRSEIKITVALGALDLHQSVVHSHCEGQIPVWRVFVECPVKSRINQDIAVCRMPEMECHDGIVVTFCGISMRRETFWLCVIL